MQIIQAVCSHFPQSFKVAEYTYQVPMPNSPLLLLLLLLLYYYYYLLFLIARPLLARVKVNHRKVYCRILAKVCAVTIATLLIKKARLQNGFCLFENIQR